MRSNLEEEKQGRKEVTRQKEAPPHQLDLVGLKSPVASELFQDLFLAALSVGAKGGRRRGRGWRRRRRRRRRRSRVGAEIVDVSTFSTSFLGSPPPLLGGPGERRGQGVDVEGGGVFVVGLGVVVVGGSRCRSLTTSSMAMRGDRSSEAAIRGRSRCCRWRRWSEDQSRPERPRASAC